MSLSDHKAQAMSSGQACDIWRTEWTYSDSAGTPVLDTDTGEGEAWNDFDPRLDDATRLTDGGTGKTTVKFPKSRRASVRHVSLEPATKTIGNFRHPVVTDIDALAGTCNVYFPTHDGATLEDPESGSRVRLALDLEYR